MALARLLARHPTLMNHVAAIMSFDLWSMHELKRMLCKMFSGSMPDMNHAGSTLHVDDKAFSPPHKLSSRHSSLVLPMDTTFQLPKVMLLTVADPPVNNFELWVDVNDYSPIDSWMMTNDSVLDGVYVKYQDEMLDSDDGAESLRSLCKKTTVGIWGKYGKDPDDYETMKYLVSCGVSFFNTDLPRHFLEPKQSRYMRSMIG